MRMKKRAPCDARSTSPLQPRYLLVEKMPGRTCVPCCATPCRLEGFNPRACRTVGATCAVCTGVVIVEGEKLEFDTRIITFVSSCENPPCSACFFLLPEYVTPTFGVITISG